MAEPKISVVILCYNYARYLAEAVESIIRQTCQNFETIIVNDGSTDNFWQVAKTLVKKYSKHKIKFINQENKGGPMARNMGIKRSRGKYIMALDADDKLAPTALEKMARLLDENPEVGIAYSWVQCFGDSDILLKHREYNFKDLIKPTCFMHSSSLFRRRAWEVTGGFNPNMKWGWQDFEFWINCGKHGFAGKLIPEPLSLWRKHPDALTNVAKKHLGELFAQIRKNHPELYPKG